MSNWLMHSKGAWKKHKYQTRTGTANHWSYTYLRDKSSRDEYRLDKENADVASAEKVNNSLNEAMDSVDKYSSEHPFGYYMANYTDKSKSDKRVKDALKAAKKVMTSAALFVKSFYDFTVYEFTKVIKHGDSDMGNYYSDDELYHWGILGMHWGVRRYQNKDGSLTSAGRNRYQFTEKNHPSKGISRKEVKHLIKDYNRMHGTNIKAKKGTFVTKGQYTYDHKGRRVQTNQQVRTKDDMNIERVVNMFKRATGRDKLDRMTTEQLEEYYNREYWKRKIKDLDKKETSQGQQFIQDLTRESAKAFVSSASGGFGDIVRYSITESMYDKKSRKEKDLNLEYDLRRKKLGLNKNNNNNNNNNKDND